MNQENNITRLKELKEKLSKLSELTHHIKEIERIIEDEISIAEQSNHNSFYFNDLTQTRDKQLERYLNARSKEAKSARFRDHLMNLKSDINT